MISITFTTVTEYLYLLKGIAKIFNSLGASAMFYLAAAVSDFYLPAPEMVRKERYQLVMGANFLGLYIQNCLPYMDIESAVIFDGGIHHNFPFNNSYQQYS